MCKIYEIDSDGNFKQTDKITVNNQIEERGTDSVPIARSNLERTAPKSSIRLNKLSHEINDEIRKLYSQRDYLVAAMKEQPQYNAAKPQNMPHHHHLKVKNSDIEFSVEKQSKQQKLVYITPSRTRDEQTSCRPRTRTIGLQKDSHHSGHKESRQKKQKSISKISVTDVCRNVKSREKPSAYFSCDKSKLTENPFDIALNCVDYDTDNCNCRNVDVYNFQTNQPCHSGHCWQHNCHNNSYRNHMCDNTMHVPAGVASAAKHNHNCERNICGARRRIMPVTESCCKRPYIYGTLCNCNKQRQNGYRRRTTDLQTEEFYHPQKVEDSAVKHTSPVNTLGKDRKSTRKTELLKTMHRATNLEADLKPTTHRRWEEEFSADSADKSTGRSMEATDQDKPFLHKYKVTSKERLFTITLQKHRAQNTKPNEGHCNNDPDKTFSIQTYHAMKKTRIKTYQTSKLIISKSQQRLDNKETKINKEAVFIKESPSKEADKVGYRNEGKTEGTEEFQGYLGQLEQSLTKMDLRNDIKSLVEAKEIGSKQENDQPIEVTEKVTLKKVHSLERQKCGGVDCHISPPTITSAMKYSSPDNTSDTKKQRKPNSPTFGIDPENNLSVSLAKTKISGIEGGKGPEELSPRRCSQYNYINSEVEAHEYPLLKVDNPLSQISDEYSKSTESPRNMSSSYALEGGQEDTSSSRLRPNDECSSEMQKATESPPLYSTHHKSSECDNHEPYTNTPELIQDTRLTPLKLLRHYDKKIKSIKDKYLCPSAKLLTKRRESSSQNDLIKDLDQTLQNDAIQLRQKYLLYPNLTMQVSSPSLELLRDCETKYSFLSKAPAPDSIPCIAASPRDLIKDYDRIQEAEQLRNERNRYLMQSRVSVPVLVPMHYGTSPPSRFLRECNRRLKDMREKYSIPQDETISKGTWGDSSPSIELLNGNRNSQEGSGSKRDAGDIYAHHSETTLRRHLSPCEALTDCNSNLKRDKKSEELHSNKDKSKCNPKPSVRYASPLQRELPSVCDKYLQDEQEAIRECRSRYSVSTKPPVPAIGPCGSSLRELEDCDTNIHDAQKYAQDCGSKYSRYANPPAEDTGPCATLPPCEDRGRKVLDDQENICDCSSKYSVSTKKLVPAPDPRATSRLLELEDCNTNVQDELGHIPDCENNYSIYSTPPRPCVTLPPCTLEDCDKTFQHENEHVRNSKSRNSVSTKPPVPTTGPCAISQERDPPCANKSNSFLHSNPSLKAPIRCRSSPVCEILKDHERKLQKQLEHLREQREKYSQYSNDSKLDPARYASTPCGEFATQHQPELRSTRLSLSPMAVSESAERALPSPCEVSDCSGKLQDVSGQIPREKTPCSKPPSATAVRYSSSPTSQLQTDYGTQSLPSQASVIVRVECDSSRSKGKRPSGNINAQAEGRKEGQLRQSQHKPTKQACKPCRLGTSDGDSVSSFMTAQPPSNVHNPASCAAARSRHPMRSCVSDEDVGPKSCRTAQRSERNWEAQAIADFDGCPCMLDTYLKLLRLAREEDEPRGRQPKHRSTNC